MADPGTVIPVLSMYSISIGMDATESATTANATAIANIDVSADIETYYDGQKYKASNVTLTASVWTTITHNLADTHPSSIVVYGAGGDLMTNSFNVEILDLNSIRVENEYPVDFTGMVVVVRA